MPPLISVVIATHNRSAYLRKALGGLAEQTLPRDRFEVLVVDNNCTDDTRQVADAMASAASVRCLRESRPGSSHARNTGCQAAQAPVCAFLDDDALPSPQWLEQLLRAFEHHGPGIGAVGGRVDPIWEAPRPAWLSPRIQAHLTIVQGDRPLVLNDDQYLPSANLAVRRDAILAAGGFDPSVDRIGDSLLSGGDTLLLWRVKQQGLKLAYWPEARVEHHIQASRLTQPWFVRRSYWQGVSDAVVDAQRLPPSRWCRLRQCAWGAKQLLKSPGQLVWLCLPTRQPHRFEHKCQGRKHAGYIAGALRRPAAPAR